MTNICTACGREVDQTEKVYRSDGCLWCEDCTLDFESGMDELALREAMSGETSRTLNERE